MQATEPTQATQRAPDLYPSRHGGDTELRDRQDPVVYGKPEDGPLDAGALERFDRDGFMFLEDLLDPEELKTCQRELDRIFEANGDNRTDEVIREPDSDVVRSVFRVHATSELFGKLARHPRLVRIAQQLLGDDVYVHHSRINYKPGFAGREFYWHSDFETWHAEDGMPRMRAVSCSIALTENTEFNGPLIVIPGSHKLFVVCPGETPENHFQSSLRKQEVGTPSPEALTELVRRGGMWQAKGAPGSAVLFDCNAMHGSNGNITPLPRSNFFVVYNAVSNAVGQPYGAKVPRPEFIRSTDFTPLTPA